MVVSFHDRGTEDIFNGIDSKAARRTCPSAICAVARRKLNQINQVSVMCDLRAPPNNRLEQLKGDRQGQHSIRTNDQYRVCFRCTEPGATDVELPDYH
jgi:proteic killer suppression protein